MFKLFRINDPYRLLLLYLVILAVRLPYWLSPEAITLEEINWLAIGEKMAEGNQLYFGIWDSISPLSAGVYWFMHVLFGKSQIALQLVAFLLICYQCALFNSIMYRNKAFNENTYVPALIYGLLMCLFFDFATLSPVLMSLTFVLLAINNVYLRIEQKLDDALILKTGVFLGIAALLHFPSGLFLISTILSLAFFTGTILRRYMLIIFGFTLPILLVALYYYWHGHSVYFNSHFLYAHFGDLGKNYLDSRTLWMIAAFPILLLFASIAKIATSPRFTNYQSRVQQVMLVLLVFSALIWLVNNKKSTYQFVIFIPASAFFISHWLLLFKKKRWSELYTAVIVLAIVILNHGTYFQFSWASKWIHLEGLLAQQHPYDQLIEGKRILVIGDQDGFYRKAKLATPYLAWELSKKQFAELNYYDQTAEILKNYKNDPPEVIIDLENQFQELQKHIYLLQTNYRQVSKQVFVLKE